MQVRYDDRPVLGWIIRRLVSIDLFWLVARRLSFAVTLTRSAVSVPSSSRFAEYAPGPRRTIEFRRIRKT